MEGAVTVNREQLRFMARNRYPVVQMETGAHGEIVYPYIREIKVIYASAEELRQGFPGERIAVSLGDRSGRSFTDVLMRDLRLPDEDEARAYALPEVDTRKMIEDIRRMTEKEATA